MPKISILPVLKWLLLLVLTVVLVVGSLAGLAYYFSDHIRQALMGVAATPVQVEEKPAPLPSPIFTALEPFTVTLAGDYKTRILYAGITIRVADDASQAMLTDYMPEVRDRVLRLLSQQRPDVVQTADGRGVLVQQLKDTLSQPYAPQPKGPVITDVLFTAFVIQ